MGLEEQGKREKLELSIPSKIDAAVKKALDNLQNLHDNLKEEYHSLKTKFNKLMQKYDALEKDYISLKEKESEVSEKLNYIKELEKDKELMYAIMDNRSISHIYSKCKDERKAGYNMSGYTEIAQYRNRCQETYRKKNTIHKGQTR